MPNPTVSNNPLPIINNSRKISQIRGRDTITYHPEHSWLVLAQYNDKIAAYHNVAINLSAITDYAVSYSTGIAYANVEAEIEKIVSYYGLAYIRELAYVGQQDNYDGISYALDNSRIGSNIVSYTHSYTMQSIMWEYFPSQEETFTITKYLLTEDGTHLLTDRNKKIIVQTNE